MGSLNINRQRGFTIVELLIVIVVIGILAAIVITSFSGVQAKARDTERQTDVKSLSTQLEAYYAGDVGKGTYPQLADFDTVAEAKALLPGLDPSALSAPGQSTVTITATATPTKDGYGYVASPASCTTACTSFIFYYKPESGAGTIVSKTSLN